MAQSSWAAFRNFSLGSINDADAPDGDAPSLEFGRLFSNREFPTSNDCCWPKRDIELRDAGWSAADGRVRLPHRALIFAFDQSTSDVDNAGATAVADACASTPVACAAA
ncbi:MAG: hypothetical protein WBW61_09460, partial [Rhodanobacteraceae bacterium]